MNVKERMKAAGFDPDLCRQALYTGLMECESIQIRIYKCRPWPYTDAVAVEATGIIEWSDGLRKPVPDGWGSCDHKFIGYYDADNLPFPEPKWPDCYRPVITYEV